MSEPKPNSPAAANVSGSWRERWYEIIFEADTPAGKLFDVLLLITILLSVAVVLVSFWLRLPPRDWAVILIAIALVWTAEFLNTALEAVVDLATEHKQHELARVGKDVGAAAVLIVALSAVLIGLLILGPPLYRLLIGDF